MLLASCGNALPAPANPVRPCPVPAAPADPDIEPFDCDLDGDGEDETVCLTIEDTIELSNWIEGMIEVELSLAGCNLVERTAE